MIACNFRWRTWSNTCSAALRHPHVRSIDSLRPRMCSSSSRSREEPPRPPPRSLRRPPMRRSHTTRPPAAGEVSAGGATLTIVSDSVRDFAIVAYASPSGRSWSAGAGADTFVRAGGRTLAFGSRAAGFQFQSAAVKPARQRFRTAPRLRAAGGFAGADPPLRDRAGFAVDRSVDHVRAGGGAPVVSDLNSVLLTLPAGTIHWVTGLQGDTADVVSDGAFTLEQKTLAVGEHLTLGARAARLRTGGAVVRRRWRRRAVLRCVDVVRRVVARYRPQRRRTSPSASALRRCRRRCRRASTDRTSSSAP